MTPADIEKDHAPSLRDMRPIWKANGGGWHGPRVETWTIPEANMEAFAADLLRALTAENMALKERVAELEELLNNPAECDDGFYGYHRRDVQIALGEKPK